MSQRAAPVLDWLSALAVLVLALCGIPLAAHAEPPPEPAQRWFGRGTKQASFSVGYGLGVRPSVLSDPVEREELRDVSIVELIPRFGIGLTPPLGGDGWYRGNLELLVEGAFLFNTEPRSGWAAGGGLSLRYNFTAGRRVVPFLEGNVGALSLDFDLRSQSDGFNFNLGLGTGLHWFAWDRVALTPGIRWQHISNAGNNQPNRGINAILFLLGASVFWD